MEYFRIRINENGIQGLLSIDSRTDRFYNLEVIGITDGHWEVQHYRQDIKMDFDIYIIEEVSEGIYKEAFQNAAVNKPTCTTIEDYIDFQQKMEDYDKRWAEHEWTTTY